MKSTVFLLIVLVVYVKADVYIVTTSSLESRNENLLSIVGSWNSDVSDANISCPDQYVIVRKELQDKPLYDGYGGYDGTVVYKGIRLCNNDGLEISGTMSKILLNALGLVNDDDEIACPIPIGVTCYQKEFAIVSGNFMGVFENDTTEATLKIDLPALLEAEFSITKEEYLPTPESATDSSDKEKDELQEAINAGSDGNGEAITNDDGEVEINGDGEAGETNSEEEETESKEEESESEEDETDSEEETDSQGEDDDECGEGSLIGVCVQLE